MITNLHLGLISISVCSPVWTQRSHDLYHTSHVDVDDISGPILCQPSISWVRNDINPIDTLITNAEIIVGNNNGKPINFIHFS